MILMRFLDRLRRQCRPPVFLPGSFSKDFFVCSYCIFPYNVI